MGPTASSHRSRGSIPHQIPPGLCHRLITLARGCRDSRAKDSTPLACPWASTTRSVLFYCLLYHATSTGKKHDAYLGGRNKRRMFYCFVLRMQQESFNGQSTNFSGGGYSYSQGNGVSFPQLSVLNLTHERHRFVYSLTVL